MSEKKAKWSRDNFVEQRLTDLGIQWEIVEVPISKIDWDASRANGARIGSAVDDDHVLFLAIALENGDELPMVVLLVGQKGYVIMAGNHRCPAAREFGLTHVTAYVIKTNDQAIESSLAGMLNSRVRQQTPCEIVALAVQAVDNGMDAKIVAKAYSLREPYLKEAIRVQRTREELSAWRFKPEALPDATIRAIGSVKNPNVRKAFTDLITVSGMPSTDATVMSRELNKPISEAAQMVIIEQGRSETDLSPHNSKRTGKVQSKASGFRRAFSAIERQLENVRKLADAGITDKSEVATLGKRMLKLGKRLAEIGQRCAA